MYTVPDYVQWQIGTLATAISMSKNNQHPSVRADVDGYERELDALKAVRDGAKTPYRTYCEEIVALNIQRRAEMVNGNFWDLYKAEPLAARRRMLKAMRWE